MRSPGVQKPRHGRNLETPLFHKQKQSSQWTEKGESTTEKANLDCCGVLVIDYFGNEKIITEAYYSSLLDFDKIIKRK